MKADEAILQLLDAPTKAPAWAVGVDGSSSFIDVAYSNTVPVIKSKNSVFPSSINIFSGSHPHAKIPIPLLPSRSTKSVEVCLRQYGCNFPKKMDYCMWVFFSLDVL